MDEDRIKHLRVSESDFVKGKDIGRGAFATVSLAKNIHTNEIVAIKTLHEPLVDITQRLMFIREIETMDKCRHPAVVELKGYCIPESPDERPFIVTEYLKNGGLDAAMSPKASPNTWDSTKAHISAFGIAVAMEFIHSKNCIHRDLKPANILLDDDFEPNVSDFGLSKVAEENNYQSMFVGSPYWMAPELLLRCDYGSPVDVYAFSIILYQLFVGSLPFPKGMTKTQLEKAVIEGFRAEIPSHIPLEYRSIIEDCWNENPDMRPQFSSIVRRLMQTTTFFPGTDVSKVKAYMSKIYPCEISITKDIFMPVNVLDEANEFLRGDGSPQEKQMKLDRIRPDIVTQIGEIVLSWGYEVHAAHIFLSAAKRNDPIANRHCGVLLYEGKEVTKNEDLGFQYLVKAADLGDQIAMQRVQEIRRQQSSTQDGGTSDFHSKQIANQLYQQAQALSAQLETNKSLALYRRAAQAGHVESQFICGRHLLNDYPTKAAVFLFHAAQNGHAESQFLCGTLLLEGRPGIEASPVKASYFLQMACEQNHPAALFKMYQLTQRIRYLKTAADYGHAEAQYIYAKYLQACGQEPSEVERYLTMAASQRHVSAMISLGKFLEPTDIYRAFDCYRSAAMLGDTTGIYNYATMLHNGPEKVRNLEEAVKFYRMAAERGDIESMTNLSKCLSALGRKAEALEAAQMAAQLQDPRGCFLYGYLLNRMNRDGSRFIQFAASRGYSRAIEYMEGNRKRHYSR